MLGFTWVASDSQSGITKKLWSVQCVVENSDDQQFVCTSCTSCARYSPLDGLYTATDVVTGHTGGHSPNIGRGRRTEASHFNVLCSSAASIMTPSNHLHLTTSTKRIFSVNFYWSWVKHSIQRSFILNHLGKSSSKAETYSNYTLYVKIFTWISFSDRRIVK